MIPGSVFIDSNQEDPTKILYFEIRKASEVDFTSEEISKLRDRLADLIKGSIERLTKPVFYAS